MYQNTASFIINRHTRVVDEAQTLKSDVIDFSPELRQKPARVGAEAESNFPTTG